MPWAVKEPLPGPAGHSSNHGGWPTAGQAVCRVEVLLLRGFTVLLWTSGVRGTTTEPAVELRLCCDLGGRLCAPRHPDGGPGLRSLEPGRSC